MNSLAHSKMRLPSSINGSLRFGRFYRRKELRKRSEIATLAPAKIGHVFLSDLPGAVITCAFTRCTPKLCPPMSQLTRAVLIKWARGA